MQAGTLSRVDDAPDFLDNIEVIRNETRIRGHRSQIIDRLPALPSWVLERRFQHSKNGLVVSDKLDRADTSNPHVKAGHVSRFGMQDVWFEAHFTWEQAEETFGKEPIREIRHTMFKYIIQRPSASAWRTLRR